MDSTAAALPQAGARTAYRWKRIVIGTLARIGITVAAAGLFLLIRQDYIRPAKIQYQRYIASSGVIDNYLKTAPVKKLQLGAGDSNMEGWLNTDIAPIESQAYLNVTERFPFPDGTFRYIYHEHLIEHITYGDGLKMLRESYRVMQPGGRIRIATPDLSKYVALFTSDSPEIQKYVAGKHEWHNWPKTEDPKAYLLNIALRDWGHQFVYSPQQLRGSLEKAGFKNVRQYGVGVSDDPALANIEMRNNWREREVNAYESMVLEAEK